MISQEEKQRSLTNVSQFNHGSTAFNASLDHSSFAAQQRPYNTRNFHRPLSTNNSTGNTNFPSNFSYKSTARPTGGQDRRQGLFREHCKMTGHTIQRCYKIHGYPPGHKLYKGRKVAAMAHTENSSGYTALQSQD